MFKGVKGAQEARIVNPFIFLVRQAFFVNLLGRFNIFLSDFL